MSESSWRTTRELVEGIVEVDDSIPLDPFIDMSNNLVTNVCTKSGYDAATLELIERWLSAHYYSIRDVRAASEGAEGVSISYQNSIGFYFLQTQYGQEAMTADFLGNLASLQKRLTDGTSKPVILWLGRGCRGSRPGGNW